jgi:AcrR family transcriptional regulator
MSAAFFSELNFQGATERGSRRQRGKGGHYHHGDLRAALIGVTIDLIAERGVRNFTLAEASRRLGVSVSAPYAHFPDREALLAEVASRAYQIFNSIYLPKILRIKDPKDRIAAIARAYVQFAAANRPLFEVVYETRLDKARYPEVFEEAKQLSITLRTCLGDLAVGGEFSIDELGTAIEATAHGYARLLAYDEFGKGKNAIRLAAKQADRAIRALVESRRSFRTQSRGAKLRARRERYALRAPDRSI